MIYWFGLLLDLGFDLKVASSTWKRMTLIVGLKVTFFTSRFLNRLLFSMDLATLELQNRKIDLEAFIWETLTACAEWLRLWISLFSVRLRRAEVWG
jgi:hypothetical protein